MFLGLKEIINTETTKKSIFKFKWKFNMKKWNQISLSKTLEILKYSFFKKTFSQRIIKKPFSAHVKFISEWAMNVKKK